MRRIVKDYDTRYTQFLNVAQRLFYSQGYSQTSVSDIIKAVGVAKGTFYHYFDSKTDILEAIVDRIAQQAEIILNTIATDTTLTPLDKIEQFYSATNQWKIAQKDDMIATARVLYQDENVLLREKLSRQSLEKYVPILANIIEEGIDEGTFDVIHALETARILFALSRNLSEAVVHLILENDENEVLLTRIAPEIAVFNLSFTRILGMPEGSLTMIPLAHIHAWLKTDTSNT